MESYLPGRPLDYATDLAEAARCIAGIYQLTVPPGHGLLVHPEPESSIFAESWAWAAVYLAWPRGPHASQTALRRSFASVAADFE